MDTLHDNEVDIGEVQVGLCGNMIGTYSAIWESYESYHSKDDTFTWESVEMNNELFDIPQQRDAPTKDCKGKGKVDYSSSSRKLKTKGSSWSGESSTSEELDEHREEGIKVTSRLTKWVELVIQKKQERALIINVNPIDCYQFHVKNLDKEDVVNLQTQECTCKEFQAEQLPCSHAIAAARDHNINVYSLCVNYYTNECLLATYVEVIYPVGNQSDWKTSEDYVDMTVLPPKAVKRVGRPKKKRIPSVGEAPKLHKIVVPSDKYFPATISCQVHKIGNLVKNKLTKEQLQIFDKTIFGPLLNVNMVFNGQLIHHFLLRVDGEEAFKSFDWSTFFYTRLLNSLETSLQGKKSIRAKEDNKFQSSDILQHQRLRACFSVLSTASEHIAIRNSKGLIPRIFRWNCTQAPSYKRLQKNIFDNKNTVVIAKLKLSTQEKAFMGIEFEGMITWNDHTRQNDNDDDQNREDMIISDQAYVEEQRTEEQHNEHRKETQREHQEKSGSDISIYDLQEMITTLPLVSQPLGLCEMAPLDQTVQIHEVPPSISIVKEESQLETTKQQVEIQKNDEAVTFVEQEQVTVPDKDEQQKPIKRRKLCKMANKKVPDEDEQVKPPTTSTKIILESTIPIPDVKIRDVDIYNPMWQVDPKLWKAY
ncbi:MuDRA-like transposase [Cucumis melo var. makuwa]|uniref:MuDRA-like transposase n=1 Tax=Cucumis melo var. makuwa TaxID=1194695 RepID=A0A5D3D537_CUCMM|nr:MuDRA-like transposase [Cucumis melo var. makuwa]